MAYEELLWSQRLEYSLKDGYVGERVWHCTDEQGYAIQKAVLGTYWAGISGEERPKCYRVVWNRGEGGQKGKGFLHAYYKTPRKLHHARIRICGTYTDPEIGENEWGYNPQTDKFEPLTGQIVVKDKNGLISQINGFYKLQTNPGPYHLVCVQTAAKSINPKNLLGYVHTVNENKLPNIMDADEKTMLMVDIRFDYTWGDDYVNIDYYLAYNPDTWDKNYLRHTAIVITIPHQPVFEWDDQKKQFVLESTQRLRPITRALLDLEYKNGRLIETQPVYLRRYRLADWSNLPGLFEW